MFGVLFAAGCGPLKREAGLAVLMASPFILGVGVLALALMSFLWKPLKPELAPRWKQVGALAGGLAVVSALCFALTRGREGFHGGSDLLPAAVWWVGASFASVALVTWRLLVQLAPGRAFMGALSLASVVMFPLAVQQIFATPGEADAALVVWVLLGYMGAVPGVLLALFVIEALVRRKKLGSAPPAP